MSPDGALREITLPFAGPTGQAASPLETALASGARLGGPPPNWQHLAPGTADWSVIHSPAHFYLFTLKALSFILLRRKQLDECREVLEKIGELDPMA
ncbi:MAG: hypothetical protein ACYCYL_12795 [Acidithiobacillus sp.]